MEQEMKKIGSLRIVDCGVGHYAIRLASSMRSDDDMLSSWLNMGGNDWEQAPATLGSVRTVPWGRRDDMPRMVRDLLERNNIGPGILQRKLGLIYGEGPALYRSDINDEGLPQRTWTTDEQVEQWLASWDARRYCREALQQYLHMNGHFTKYVMGKGVRIGRAWVHHLECLDAADCRLVWPGDGDSYMPHPQLADIRQVIHGDIDHSQQLQLFPVFRRDAPTAAEAAIGYHNLASFGRTLYSVCSFFGSIPWMQNANDIADIVRVLNENMIAAAYIVHEPSGYWEQKRMALLEDHPDWTNAHIDKELENLRDGITRKLAEVMAGKRNAGKFFTCVDFIDDRGTLQEWKVEPIDMNIDKYLSAQQKISKIADSASTSGFGLSASLANIIIDGKSDSGSQMLYAVKLFFAADTQIAEEIALEALNDAIHINFPDRQDLAVGFYHRIIQKEDNVSAGERAVNQL